MPCDPAAFGEAIGTVPPEGGPVYMVALELVVGNGQIDPAADFVEVSRRYREHIVSRQQRSSEPFQYMYRKLSSGAGAIPNRE